MEHTKCLINTLYTTSTDIEMRIHLFKIDTIKKSIVLKTNSDLCQMETND